MQVRMISSITESQNKRNFYFGFSLSIWNQTKRKFIPPLDNKPKYVLNTNSNILLQLLTFVLNNKCMPVS